MLLRGTCPNKIPDHYEPGGDSDAHLQRQSAIGGELWHCRDQVKTGSDGALWYEVFVGGPQNAWVPADALSLPYPLPE